MIAMATEINVKTTLRQRAVLEMKEFAILTVYLYVTFGTLILMKAAVLHTHGIHYAVWNTAIVKSLLIAKFMLLGKGLKIGERYKGGPLVWPTLYKAFGFLPLLVILTVIEETVVGLFHHRSISAMLSELVGPRLEETLVEIQVLLLVLIPFFAFSVLGEALGEGSLMRMFFIGPAPVEQNPPPDPVSQGGKRT
jgi:hypothetical protein